MPKVLAIQNCQTSKGRMVAEFKTGEGKVVWPGDVEDLPEAEVKAFGPKHLKPAGQSAKVQRWDKPEDREAFVKSQKKK